MKANIPIPVGTRFGRLVTTSLPFLRKPRESSRSKRSMVSAICDCGIIKDYVLIQIRNGNTSSCGCYNKEQTSKAKTKHGLSYKHPLYHVWKGMKSRCYNPKHQSYHSYGGRGITVCAEWLNDFKKFYDWCMENGYEDGLEIDRINTLIDNYTPTTCRIVTSKENGRTKLNSVIDQLNVNRLRTAKEEMEISVKDLSDIFKIREGHVRKILRREIWD